MRNIYLPTGWLQYEDAILKAVNNNHEQIKEKFGRLAVTVKEGEEFDRVALNDLMRQCVLTCMTCGNKEKIYHRSFDWIGPICEDCIKGDF